MQTADTGRNNRNHCCKADQNIKERNAAANHNTNHTSNHNSNHNSQVRPPIFSTAGTPFKISIILEELFQRCSKIHWFYTSITLILTKYLLTWIIRRLVKILLRLLTRLLRLLWQNRRSAILAESSIFPYWITAFLTISHNDLGFKYNHKYSIYLIESQNQGFFSNNYFLEAHQIRWKIYPHHLHTLPATQSTQQQALMQKGNIFRFFPYHAICA